MSLFLLAPEARGLVGALVLGRAVPAPHVQPLFRSQRANRAALAVQIAFGVYLLGMFSVISVWYFYADGGAGAPKSPLYDIWNILELSIDGEVCPSVLNDYDRRWRRVMFDRPDVMVFQRTDGPRSSGRSFSSLAAAARRPTVCTVP